MLMLPYRYCEDEAADLRIQQNINLLIAKMLEHQMDTACAYNSLSGYKALADPANTAAFYRQIAGLFPKWIEADDAVAQFVLFYSTIQSRRFFKPYLLQDFLLDRLIAESIYLATEILVGGEDTFRIPFSLRDREIVGNAFAYEFYETVVNVYQSMRKRKGKQYLIYSSIPYPAEKVEMFENIFGLKSICFFDETYTMLEVFSPSQLTALNTPKSGLIEPVMKIPERWWTRTQDICDIQGNPPGVERSTAEIYMPYMGMLDNLDE